MDTRFLSRRRESLVITVSILKSAKKRILKTHLLGSASLSYTQLVRYLDFLEANGFIEKNGNQYKTTMKGLELIMEFESSPLTQYILTT